MFLPVFRSGRRLFAALTLAGALLPAAHAGVDSVISFDQPGRVDIILTGNQGGFDHILEPVLVGGNAPFWAFVPTGPAWMVGTQNDSLLNLVGDSLGPRQPTAFNVTWGYFDIEAGQEISLRLTNVQTERIGGTDADQLGTIYSQLFSGSGAVNNTTYSGGSVSGGSPGSPDPGGLLGGGYTQVTFISATQIDVAFADLFAGGTDPFSNMTVTLMLTPVPEPGPAALLLAGLGVVALLLMRRP